MRLRHSHAIFFSGFIWLGIGVLLLTKGIQYLVIGGNIALNQPSTSFSLIHFFSLFSKDREQATFILIAFAMVLGFFKGRFVLKKSVNRIVERIRSRPSPIPLTQIYSPQYLMLMGAMMLMGMVFKFLPIPDDIKGFIDFTVGIALLNGSMLFLRRAT